MTLDEIVKSIKTGEKVELTRPCWNKDNLEFWISIEVRKYNPLPLEIGLFELYGYGCVDPRGKITIKEEFFTRCKDGDVVPDSFKLNDEDLQADDWVII